MMAAHNTTGLQGEMLAADYLTANGYDILYRNWRCSYYETDIIADKNGVLHFIEVKTRHSVRFGYPEEAVNSKKFGNLKKCAVLFLALHPGWKRIQFDILSIIQSRKNNPEFFLIEDVWI
ncbi:MAG: YraN family protein [Flavitalea sp.]